MFNKDLTIIILSYNTKAITDKCLSELSLAKKFCEDTLNNKIAVTVVDNASSDASAEMIKEKYLWVNLIESKENLGFAKGNNLAMKKAKTPFILLINSDIFLDKDTLVEALSIISKNKDCDALSVKYKYPGGGFQSGGGFLPTPMRTLFWLCGFESVPFIKRLIKPIYVYNKSYYERKRTLEWASAAFFLIKRAIYEKTRGFDENLFLYMEDIEWCKRIKDSGFNICYTPDVSVLHLEGTSSNNFQDKLENQIKGLIYYHKKHYPQKLVFMKKSIRIGLFLRYILYRIMDSAKSGSYLKVYKSL